MISFLIPFRSNDPYRKRSLKYVYERLAAGWPDDEVLVANNPDTDFRISRSRNLAARAAKGDTLVFVDADTWTPEDQMREALDYVALNDTWAHPYDRYFTLTEGGTEKFFANGGIYEDPEVHQNFDVEFHHAFPSAQNPDPAVAGAVVVSRTAFEKVNGYDDRYIGWGEEDRAFVMALETLVAPGVRVSGSIYHLWHPAPESERFEQPFFNHNRSLCNRYRRAQGKPLAMAALVAEH